MSIYTLLNFKSIRDIGCYVCRLTSHLGTAQPQATRGNGEEGLHASSAKGVRVERTIVVVSRGVRMQGASIHVL